MGEGSCFLDESVLERGGGELEDGIPLAGPEPGDRLGSYRVVRSIDTYETGERPGVPADLESPVAEEIDKRVRSLGYVD